MFRFYQATIAKWAWSTTFANDEIFLVTMCQQFSKWWNRLGQVKDTYCWHKVNWLGLRVGSHLVQFDIHQINQVNSCNDFVMRTGPPTLLSLVLLLIVYHSKTLTKKQSSRSILSSRWQFCWTGNNFITIFSEVRKKVNKFNKTA